MIAKFKTYTHSQNNHLFVTTVTGKISKIFLSDEYYPDTTNISITKLYFSIGNMDYCLDDIHGHLILTTKTNEDHIISKEGGNLLLDGSITHLEQIYERLSLIYVNENLVIEN